MSRDSSFLAQVIAGMLAVMLVLLVGISIMCDVGEARLISRCRAACAPARVREYDRCVCEHGQSSNPFIRVRELR